jgi:hypothetical protein
MSLGVDEKCNWIEPESPYLPCEELATQVLMGWDHGEWFELALCDEHAVVYRAEGIEEVTCLESDSPAPPGA